MSEKTIEWNLGFAYDEVRAGLEQLLTEAGYTFTHANHDNAAHFQVTFPQGLLELAVRPLPSQQSPFKAQIFFHRTLLTMTYRDVSAQEEETFLHRLTLKFLRAGG